MALKLKKCKAFPLRKDLIDLAFSAGIPRSSAGNAVDALAQKIQDCLNMLPEVEVMQGLKDSILKNLGRVMANKAISAPYRHQKKRKYQ